MKNIFYNYTLKSDEDLIYITFRISKDKVFILCYVNGEIIEKKIDGYETHNDIIEFNGNFLSNNIIHLKEINLDLKINNGLMIGSFRGIQKHFKYYFDKEQFKKLPYKYMKFVCVDFDNYNGKFSLNYNYINKESIKLFFEINQNTFKEKRFIVKKNKDISFTLKTSKYIYKIKNELEKYTSSSKELNIKVGEVSSVISVNKIFNRPFINANTKKMLYIISSF